MYNKLALEFLENGLSLALEPSLFTVHGPFSPNKATSEEQPGPPLCCRF
jgi:hypothetical protein